MRDKTRNKLQKAEIEPRIITRRDFLWMTSMSTAGVLLGCAANPVTGRRQLMLMSEDKEISIDRENSPHQFSADYGGLQDKQLNNYISRTGKNMAAQTHRPQMPYNFQGVNATYVNAYAFPGGSIGVTRGILLSIDNEAELAALLGHELGHVNARHTSEIMSKRVVTTAIVGGVAAYVGVRKESAGAGIIAAQLGMLSSGVLLAKYSRDNERQADGLGMEYMVKTGYSPDGMVGLMNMLNNMSKKKGSATQLLFATHPMSNERYRTAVSSAETKYSSAKNKPVYRERYMDHTANLRKLQGAIKQMQKGEALLGKQKYGEAEAHFAAALKQAPNDYAGLVMMATCQLAQKKFDAAGRYADKGKKVYPDEAQAHYLSGYAKIQQKNYEAAYNDFSTYEKRLPGNPYTNFFKGLSLEGMERIESAAQEYYRFLQQVNQGKEAQYAHRRLREWGYIR
jgi:predicted Zn-dependent protease